MTYSYNPDPTTTTTTEAPTTTTTTTTTAAPVVTTTTSAPEVVITPSNLNRLEEYIQGVRQQNEIKGPYIRSLDDDVYDDDQRYNFLIGYNEGSLENVSETVKSNPNLELKYTLTYIKTLIVEGKAENFLSLVRQRSDDIEYIEIDLGTKITPDAKVKYSNKNYTFKNYNSPKDKNNKEDLIINRGVVSAINASQTPTGILEPPRNFFDYNVVNCGQHLEKAVVKVKKASKTADVVVWEIGSGLAESNIKYTTNISFDPAANGNGLPLVTYYDWWKHVPEISSGYAPINWQNQNTSPLHPTNVISSLCHPQLGLGAGKTVYFIGEDARPLSPDGTGGAGKTAHAICLNSIVGFHVEKFTKNEKPPGTIVNMSFGARPVPGIPNDPYKIAQLYYNLNAGLNNQVYIVYYKNGVRKTHLVRGSDNEQQRAETARIVKGLGINSNNSLDNCSFRFYDRSIPAPPEFTPAFELAQNRTIREACRPRQLSNGKVIPGIQFVTAGGNNGSGFYNYNPGDSSDDERSRTYYVYDQATMDQPMQKIFTCVRQIVTFAPADDLIVNGVVHKAQKLIVVGGHDYKETWYSNDSQKRNGIHAKGNWGSCVDFKAQYVQDLYGSGLQNKMTDVRGTSFSCPLFVGLAASMTKSASPSSMEKILDQCVRKLSFEDAWDTTSTGGQQSSPEWNTYVYGKDYIDLKFRPYIFQVPKNRVKKYKLFTNYVNTTSCGSDQQLYPPKNARMNLDEDNTNLSYPDFLPRNQKQFNGVNRKRHGNLMRTSNRRGFDD